MGIDRIKSITDQSDISPSDKSRGTKGNTSATNKNDPNADINGTNKTIFEPVNIRNDRIKEVKDKINQGYYNKTDVKKEAINNFLDILS